MTLLLTCLLTVSVAVAGAQSNCTGGFREGDVVDKGVYWYKCVNGVMEPQGCLSASEPGKRVTIGESFVNRGVEITCVWRNGVLQFIQTACLYKGQRITPDQAFEDTEVWYVCERANDLYLLWKAAGCMHKGKRVNVSDRVRDEGTLYECQKSSSPDAQLVVVGCVRNDNKEHMIGEQFQDGSSLYTCEANGDKAVERVFGCIHNGQIYYDYQVYQEGEQIFRCVVNTDRTKAEHQVCGCVQKMKTKPAFEKLIGCFWAQEDEDKPGNNEAYLMNCKKDKDGKAYAERVRCLYTTVDNVRLEIDPGCFRNLAKGDQSVGCVTGEKGIQIQTFPSDRLDIAFTNRLRFC